MTLETLWQAVLTRDTRADGTFVYGVRSTRIYCRPSCPSRRPGRTAVSFFPGPTAAEAAGFRACRRCHPRAALGSDPRLDRIRAACRLLAANGDRPVTLTSLARAVGGSPYHLQRTFKQVLGLSPREYADGCRLGRFKAELRGGRDVTTALYEAGYGSSSRVYERADETLGMTPAAYRAGGRGADVRFVTAGCSLGRLLVAATSRGVCAVKLGDRDDTLVRLLREEYPAAQVSAGDSTLKDWLAAVLQSIEGAAVDPGLPLDVRATAFQLRVWRALRAIPPGETRSYAEIARRIGRPGAARAVARACAANPVALVVPCHRVVQSDGGLGGYHWGVERKQALLASERKRSGIGVGQ